MIIRATQTLAEFNATGIDNLLLYSQTVQPLFIPLILFSFFLLISLSSFFGTRRYSDRGDIFLSLTVGSFMTSILSILFTLKEGLINIETVITCIVITIIFGGIFFVSSKER